MKITIIINNNDQSSIIRLLNSLVIQKYNKIEVIIFYNEKAFPQNNLFNFNKIIKIIYIDPYKKNTIELLNEGISRASGSIITILSFGFHYYSSKTIDLVMDFFRNSEFDIICSSIELISSNKNQNNIPLDYFHPDLFATGGLPPLSSIFIRKAILKERENFMLSEKGAANYSFIFRLFNVEKCKILFIPEPLILVEQMIFFRKNFSYLSKYCEIVFNIKKLNIFNGRGWITFLINILRNPFI